MNEPETDADREVGRCMEMGICVKIKIKFDLDGLNAIERKM